MPKPKISDSERRRIDAEIREIERPKFVTPEEFGISGISSDGGEIRMPDERPIEIWTREKE